MDELAKLEGMRAATGVGTGASSDKSQQWVHLHMAIAEKRISVSRVDTGTRTKTRI